MRYCPICENTFDDQVRRCPTDDVRTLVVDEGMRKFIGRVLDQRWRLLSLIGEGGMGAVFEGRQISVERPVAVKLIRGEFAQEELIVSRFFREAKVMSTLQHPNIITMLDFGQDEETGALYLVMELLRGKPLSALLERKQRFTLSEVVQIGEQIAGALAEAHRQSIIHRDLKPDNLFIDRVQGRGLHVTLLDFGIARVDDNKVTKLTKTGAIQGTPTYMAPEQVEGVGVTPQTDLYAVGVILYEIIAGHEPFRGEGLMQVLMAHLTMPVPELADHWALSEPVCPSLVAVVHRLLAKSPDDRYGDAIELLRDLQAIQLTLSDVGDMGFASTLAGPQGPVFRPLPSGPMRLPSGTAIPLLPGSSTTLPAVGAAAAAPAAATAPPPSKGGEEWALTSDALPKVSASPTLVPPPAPSRTGLWLFVAAAVLLVASGLVVGTWLLVAPTDSAAGTATPGPAPTVAADTPDVDAGKAVEPSPAAPLAASDAGPGAEVAEADAEVAPAGEEPRADNGRRRRRTDAKASPTVDPIAQKSSPVEPPPKDDGGKVTPTPAETPTPPSQTDQQKKRQEDLERELKKMMSP